MADFMDLILDAPALREATDKLIRGHLYAARVAVDVVTREYEKRLETATAAVSKGRLHKAWASDVQPRKGRIARDPAGYIYINGGARTRSAIEFLTTSGRIQAKDGGPVAIPLPAAGNRGRDRLLTPDEWQRQTGKLLTLVKPRGRPAMLVANGTLNGRTGRYRAITRKRTAADARRGFVRGEASIPIFILLYPRDFQSRFTVENILRGSGDRLASVFAQQAALVNAARNEVRDRLG